MGFVSVSDMNGLSTSHAALWKNPFELLKILKWAEQSAPLRHKEIHLYHVPSVLKYVIDAAKSIISNKMKERVHVSFMSFKTFSKQSFNFQIHVNIAEMNKQISSIDVLPKEMGGKIPKAQMLELFKQELHASRNRLIALDDMKILNDSGIIGRRNVDKNNNTVSDKSEQVIGSFRKLEID